MSDLVVCRNPFFAGETLVQGGSVWAQDDPIVKSYPEAFRPLVVSSSKPAKAKTPRRVAGRFAPRKA